MCRVLGVRRAVYVLGHMEVQGGANVSELETENCRITAAELTTEDHNMLTFWITLEGAGWGQCLGGNCLERDSMGWGPGLVAIRKIMDTVGVSKWSDLKGTLCRAKVGTCGSNHPPIIGHIIEDKWFNMKEFVAANKSK